MSNLTAYRLYLLRKIVLALLLVVAFFIPLELFSRFIAATSLASFGEAIRVDQKTLITDSMTSSGIVGIGDSIIARSFYPELFSSILSENLTVTYPVYNLGVEGSSLTAQISSYYRLLKNDVKPYLVIIDVPVHELNTYHAKEKYPAEALFGTFADYHSRCEEYLPASIAANLYCATAKYSYFIRLLNFYHQQLNNSSKNLLHTAETRHANLVQNDPAVSFMGFSPVFNVLTPESVNTEYLYQAMMNTYADTYKVYHFGTERLDMIINEFNKNSTKVILVLMPLYQPVMRKIHDAYAIPENKMIVNTLAQYAKDKNVAFINLFEELQQPENFQDPVHLNVIGAAKITRLLANKILTKDYVFPEGYLDSELYQFMKPKGHG